MVLLLVVGAVVGGLLCWAGWLDLCAARRGQRWVPERAGRLRTRFRLVERADHHDQRRRLAYEQAVAERDRRRQGPADDGYLLPLRRLTRGSRKG